MKFLSMLALQGVQKCITVNCRGREREREPKYVKFLSMLALQGVQKCITVNCRGREREERAEICDVPKHVSSPGCAEMY